MIYLVYLVLVAVIASVVIGLLLKRTPNAKVVQLAKKLRDSQQVFGDLSELSGHSFHAVDLFGKPTYSSSSGQPLLLGGLHCDKCGICVANDERTQAKTYLKCKPLFIDDVDEEPSEDNDGKNGAKDSNNNNNNNEDTDDFGAVRDHHWVVGNLPLLSICALCGQPAGHEPRLVDYFCSLCHRTVHDKCLGTFLAAVPTRFCDLGSLARYSIPPWCVRVRRSRVSPSRLLKGKTAGKISLSRLCSPPGLAGEWQPVFVFANRLAGNADAEAVLHAFRLHLNPVCQVFDLSVHRDPAAILTTINDVLPPSVTSFIALVAGGDGTVRWIANAICHLSDAFASRQRHPLVGVLPLGTGNDLARALGLGKGHCGSLEVIDYLKQVLAKCKPIILDRWRVDIGVIEKKSPPKEAPSPDTTPPTRSSRTSRLAALRAWRPRLPSVMKSSAYTSYMYNYISIGADALVALSFAQRRDATPWLCNSRLINKLIYGMYGVLDMFQRECHDLHQHLRLTLDDRVIEKLPKIEVLIFLNISSWGGGCPLLEMGVGDENSDSVTFKEQKFDDGIIEVLGIYSSMHMAQLQAGFGAPVRIGQAKRVTVDLLKRFPVQVDGEAWKQSPARINISQSGQVSVLARMDNNEENEFSDE